MSERSKATQWKPGQSGNPAGRPKGARNKISETFIQALEKDFSEHGAEVIEKARNQSPIKYLQIIGKLVPKDYTVEHVAKRDMTDTEMAARVTTLIERTHQRIKKESEG